MSQQINLYNPAFRPQKKIFSAATLLQALAAIAAGTLAMYAFQTQQNATLEQVFAENDRLLVARREQVLRLTQQLAGRINDKSVGESLARAEERLQTRRALLREVRTGAGGNAAGFSEYLAALARRTMPGLWLTGIELGKANDLVLKGRVLQSELVPAYIRALKQEAPFAGRSVSELRLVAKEEPAPPAQTARAPTSFVEFFMSIPL